MKINVEPKFSDYTCLQDYLDNNVLSVEPMTAKEYLNDEELEVMLISKDYIAEEKLDGTRCTMHIGASSSRLFSRRISKKTDWYSENTDSVPHLRDIVSDIYDTTVLDGEMRIEGKEFKEVSSTLNCTYDKAIDRQKEIGFITFHAFDIIYYKGVYIAKMPLIQRKALLHKVVKDLKSEYILEEYYTDDKATIEITSSLLEMANIHPSFANTFPNLHQVLMDMPSESTHINVDKRTWYEYIIALGGEGLMLKPKNGTYKHTRGREYTKLKKFETWDCVIVDYIPPTKEYTGKELSTWEYWYDEENNTRHLLVGDNPHKRKCVPVTKHFFYSWIGTVKYGVLISPEELKAWSKTNPKEKAELVTVNDKEYLVVGEASGFDEDTRKEITNNKHKYYGSVIELKAQEVLKTGKLRHPRFLRFRNDKEAERCDWSSHIRK